MSMGRAGRQLHLSGVFAAAVTPNRRGSLDVDYSALMDQLDFLADAKVSGICLMGAVGEFLNYSFVDRQRAVYLGTKRSRVPLLVGVSHSTLAGALQLAGEAISSGADGLLLMPPYFFSYGQAEIEEFFRVFARETGDAIPIVICNAPQFTSNIETETLRRLMATRLFAGVSDASGDWPYFERVLDLKRELGFQVLAGNDRIALAAAQAGADAVLSDCGAAIPEVAVRLWAERSDSANRRMVEFLDWADRFPYPVAIKRALELRKQKGGDFAAPFDAERQKELGQFGEWFRAWWPSAIKA
jgi:4-hydroxy-tetrahydrodipicolinate synthase